MLVFAETRDSLLMSFIKFYNLSSTRLPQLKIKTEKFCRLGEEVEETVMDLLNGLAADFYDEKIIKLVQLLD
jgi:hypothetical protein